MTNSKTKEVSFRGANTFIITALIVLMLGSLMLVGNSKFFLGDSLVGHGRAWINLMIYGFGLPAVFGAVYRAVPTSFGGRINDRVMVFLHYVLHMIGFLALMILPFISSIPPMPMAASFFIACGILLFIVNVMMAVGKMDRPGAAGAFLSVLCVWLAVMGLAGQPLLDSPPFGFLEGTQWSVGLLVFIIAGVFFNTQIALALRAAAIAAKAEGERNQMAWYGMLIMNCGVALSFAATAFGPLMFLVVTSSIYLVGVLCVLIAFWQLAQRRETRTLSWDTKIQLASVWMIAGTAIALLYNLYERMGVSIEAVVDAEAAAGLAEVAGPGPISVGSLDWSVGLLALLLAVVPGLVAIIFNLQKATKLGREEAGRGKIAGQVQLAIFFNYCIGAGLLVVGAWGLDAQMLTLGAVFLAVGAVGFLGNFLYHRRRSAQVEGIGQPA